MEEGGEVDEGPGGGGWEGGLDVQGEADDAADVVEVVRGVVVGHVGLDVGGNFCEEGVVDGEGGCHCGWLVSRERLSLCYVSVDVVLDVVLLWL